MLTAVGMRHFNKLSGYRSCTLQILLLLESWLFFTYWWRLLISGSCDNWAEFLQRFKHTYTFRFQHSSAVYSIMPINLDENFGLFYKISYIHNLEERSWNVSWQFLFCISWNLWKLKCIAKIFCENKYDENLHKITKFHLKKINKNDLK
jgi:hypothetical protein